MTSQPDLSPEAACHPDGGRGAPPQAVTVLGIGNVLWADEGFGVRCAELLQQRYEFDAPVRIVDGGTQGLYLIDQVSSATHLVIFDAIDYGLAPGTLMTARDDEVPQYLGARKMSLHQTGFQEVLALARLTGRYPQHVLLVGCQPEELEDYGGSLRPSVRAALDGALALACAELAAWGCPPRPRTTPLAEDEAITPPHLALERYEAGRPSEAEACRIGDARFLATRTTGDA
jgi:hydrogenase maturation protease